MAVETVEIRLDEAWKLISAVNTAVVSWQVTSFGEALFYISDTAPAAGSFVGQTTRNMPPTVFGSAKVYARAVRDSAKVSVQRTVDAANAAASPILQALTLSASALQTTTPSGTVIGTLQNRLAGSTTTLLSSRRRLALSADGASLLVGLQPAAPGKFFATIREEHPDAGIRDTTLELTVTAPALTISGSPPSATEGLDYTWQPVVSGGYGARSFSLSGSLPTGWSQSSTTGAIYAPGVFVRASLPPISGIAITVSDDTGQVRLSLSDIIVLPGAGAVFRGGGTNTTPFARMDASGAAQTEFLDRDPIYEQHAFDEIDIVVPKWTLDVISNVVTEVDLPDAYDFEFAVEYPYNDSATVAGNSVYQALCNGQVTHTSTPGEAEKETIFTLKLPFAIPKGEPFGIIRYHACVAGRTGALTNKRICRPGNASSFVGRKGGTVVQVGTVSTLKGQTLTRKSFTAHSSTQVGTVASFLPTIRTRHSASEQTALLVCNSTGEGPNEGTPYSGIVGDAGVGDGGGDIHGNKDWAARFLDMIGVGCTNMSRGSDSVSDRLLAGNYDRRARLSTLLAPTFIIDIDGHNKIPAGASTRAASTLYNLDDTYRANGSGYRVTVAGTTDATSGPTGTGTAITDGTAVVRYLGPDDMGTGSAIGIAWAGKQRKWLRLVEAANPGIPILGVTMSPDCSATSPDVTTSGKSGSNVAVSAYTYDTGTGNLVLTVGTTVAGKLLVGSRVGVKGLTSTPNTVATSGTTFTPLTAIDTGAGTITVVRPTGLTSVAGTAVLNTKWADPTLQVPFTNFEPGSSYRSWQNRLLRNMPSGALPYRGVIDVARFCEFGNGVTPGTETGVWDKLLEGGASLGSAATNDGIHRVSLMAYKVAAALAADAATVAMIRAA